MTLFSIRTVLMLCLAGTLASCGGGDKATFVIGGTATNLKYTGLILQWGNQKLAVAPTSTATNNVISYAFPEKIEYGTTYGVTVAHSPAQQVCTAYMSTLNGSGLDSAGHTASINVPVTCVSNVFALGGVVTGLTGTGLQLINGSVDGPITIAAGAASFTFPLAVEVDTGYGISVLTQPVGQTCTVANGTGIMPNFTRDAAIANPTTVTCVNK